MRTTLTGYSILLIIGLIAFSSCQKKNCPTFWGPADNTQVASDSKKDSGENLDTEDGERTVEFPVIRVKRDKNGIVTKQQPKKGKKMYKDPRKDYKPQRN
ncbi:hypothetical protein Q0590_01480 [Rhodocytophaga aerolata]|uniref:Uncharacterized protein n=1 Tax=Rhodocytophaga aerolata TaxID=455078 RepID=A0ABT8R0W9_9BACT|nr:hypothetical protein [Rhodocytophaga aerolata]MDO1444898.1 hypothetical protein [Rhodocytophaga aerolata]